MTTNDQIILEQVLGQKRSDLAPGISVNEYFEVFVAEQVLKDYDLSYEEIEKGIVGDGGDGGIDALYVFANGELVQEDFDFSALKKNIALDVVIMQAKYSNGFRESAVEKLIAVSEDLLNLSKELKQFSGVYNEGVLSGIASFRRIYEGLAAKFPVLRFRFVYATRGIEVHPNVQRKADILKEKLTGLFSAAEYVFEFLGAEELLQLARRAPVTSYTISLSEIPISTIGDVGYVCLVRLVDFNSFVSDEHGQLRKTLFEANVRDYQGSTQVNEEIQSSLQAPMREDFWWLNNGITVVASKATQSGKTLTFEDPQIVNGLQTSTEIYNYFRKANTEGENRTLLVRVIVPTAPESRDRIIKATNSQTYIPPASLRATDKIHRDIEEYLKPYGLYYDRRKNFYKNEGKRLDQIVSIPLMAQAVMAVVLQRPDTARARPSSLLKSDDDYNKLFSGTYPIEMYRFCITLLKKIEAFLRDHTDVLPKHRNNLRFYVATYLAALLSEQATPSAKVLCSLSLEAITIDALTSSFETVHAIYQELGASDDVARGSALLATLRQDLSARFPETRIQKPT